MRTMPHTEIDDPTRTKLRKDSVLPSCTKSNTERDEPRRPTPNNDTDDARRAKERRDMELPMCTKSRTETDDAKRAKDPQRQRAAEMHELQH